MLAALVAPEAIIAWAWRQRKLAIRLANNHEGEGWTITHGFFATMGGFMEYEGNTPIRVLLPEDLESYSLTGNGDFPRISKAEIEDRSKGDALSKGFVVVQTSWFVTQCIARGVQGLPLTELELVTVAFAALNVVIFFLWWHKPLNVQRGVRVYKKRNTEQPVDDGGVEVAVEFWVAFRDALSELPATITRGPEKDEFIENSWLTRVIFWPIYKPFQIIRGRDDDYEHSKTRRVKTFYPDEWGGNAFMGVSLVTAITLAFGSIHCVAWSFSFPSNTERTLWRAASACIIGVPIVYWPLAFVFDTYTLCNDLQLFQGIFLLPLIILYVLSRLVLLVLPFLCLRSLPPAAYYVVHWTSFIPHV